MTQTIINLGTGGAALNGRNGSTASADSNDAEFLSWPGDNGGNYVYLSGVSTTNFLRLANDPAWSITGDFQVECHIAPDSLSVNQITIFRNNSYQVRIDNLSRLNLRWRVSGVELSRTSTVSLPFAANTPFWFRCTLDVDNGASGHDVQFFTSSDGVTFTQLGTTITTAGTTSIDAATSPIDFGAFSTIPFAGKFYAMRLFNGIGGTKVLDVDASRVTSGAATSFTALTGQTVTISRGTSGRKTVAVVSPVWLLGTDDRITAPNDPRLHMTAGADRTYLLMYRVWDDPINSAIFFDYRGTAPVLGQMRNNASGQLAYFVNDGLANIGQTLPAVVAGQLGMRGFSRDIGAGVFRRISDGARVGTNADALGPIIGASLFGIGATGAGSSPNDLEVFAFLVYDRVLSDAELSQVFSYYTNKVA
jgi:hypothetical protein